MNGLALLFAIVMGVAALFGVTLFAALATWLLAQSFDAVARLHASTDFVMLYCRVRALLESHKQESSTAPDPQLVVLGRDVLTQTKFLQGVVNGKVLFDRSRDAAKRLSLEDRLALASWLRVLEERYGYSDVFVLVGSPASCNPGRVSAEKGGPMVRQTVVVNGQPVETAAFRPTNVERR